MIKVKVIFFASFKEKLNCSELEQLVDDGSTINELCEMLADKGESWYRLFSSAPNNVKVACNQEMVTMTSLLSEGDEVAFFPPVTGG